MENIVDLDRYPIDRTGSPAWKRLVAECRGKLATEGLFTLPGFVLPDAVAKSVSELIPLLATQSFSHHRRHNIYFRKSVPDLASDHAALREFDTSNQTICADQMGDSIMVRLYEYPPFAAFLATVMDKPQLHTMADPLARVNVMGYAAGQALNWHFDRSEFTTTLLLQAPERGGVFEYARDLRSDHDPNYEGVAALLEGRTEAAQMPLDPGGLNVFKGKNTAHRVTPVSGETDRIIAVFSYFDRPGVRFSEAERVGFYGRAS